MNPTVALEALGWYSSILPKTPRLRFVCDGSSMTEWKVTDNYAAKFTGYQYGGRPLGLTYVKYQNANGGDVMEDAEATGGITQDQLM